MLPMPLPGASSASSSSPASNQILYSWDPRYEYRTLTCSPLPKNDVLRVTSKDVDSSHLRNELTLGLSRNELTLVFRCAFANERFCLAPSSDRLGAVYRP